MWGKQQKVEEPLDVNDVSLGHITKLKWTERESWVWSLEIAHPVIIPKEQFDLIEGRLASGARQKGGTKARVKTVHPRAPAKSRLMH